MIIKKISSARGELTVPGDKSISHRAVMFGSLAKGTTHITGFLKGADCLSTIDCFRNMGIEIDIKDDVITVYGEVVGNVTIHDMAYIAHHAPCINMAYVTRENNLYKDFHFGQ